MKPHYSFRILFAQEVFMCSYCGREYNVCKTEGHYRFCVSYEYEMYRLAAEWKESREDDVSWKRRYDMIVGFFLEKYPPKVKNPLSEIEKLAYYKWEQAGKPMNRDTEFWLAAEKELCPFESHENA